MPGSGWRRNSARRHGGSCTDACNADLTIADLTIDWRLTIVTVLIDCAGRRRNGPSEPWAFASRFAPPGAATPTALIRYTSTGAHAPPLECVRLGYDSPSDHAFCRRNAARSV